MPRRCLPAGLSRALRAPANLSGYVAILRERLGGDDCAEPPFTLSEWESQTLRLVAVGQSNKEIVRPSTSPWKRCNGT